LRTGLKEKGRSLPYSRGAKLGGHKMQAKIWKRLSSRIISEERQYLAEYVLIFTLVVIAVFLVFQAFASSVQNLIDNVVAVVSS
jgi:hypothetical protein